MNPRFPIYIVSKGRHQPTRRLTSRAFEAMGVPYFIIVEAAEYDLYAAGIDAKKILVLDPAFQDRYETFDDLGTSKSKGPGAARNFAWTHAKASGAPWHWVMDDNIRRFSRLQHNSKTRAGDGTIFRCMEDFCLRYANVAMAGPNYEHFVTRKVDTTPPYVLNTRIYSCNLIRNDAPFHWRGRYNEDTDLSLQMLKRGWVTVQFNAFLQKKMETQTVKGGCDRDFYAVEGTRPKSEMLVRMHPDVAQLVWKFGRWHHHVDYRPFKHNRLILADGVVVADGPDEYGMVLVDKPKGIGA